MRISGANTEMEEEVAQEQYRKRAGRKGKDGSSQYTPRLSGLNLQFFYQSRTGLLMK